MHPLVAAVPLHARPLFLLTALAFVALDYALTRLTRHDCYDLRETAASVAVGVVQGIIRVAEATALALPFVFVAAHRLFSFHQTGTPALLGLLLGSEFLYYWQHRASHRIRWMWATHVVHHSPTRLNPTAAIRLGWTGTISGNFLFMLPLVWIGYHPTAVLAMLGANLAYQFFIHTELPVTFGPLEWVLNTPAHHRVHHASNAACRDRNYGGVLIIFDRLFGSFAPAPPYEALRYGVVGGVASFNPVTIALREWAVMLGDARRARGWRARAAALFAPPGRTHACEAAVARRIVA